jgi:site-specific recombinase XerD
MSVVSFYLDSKEDENNQRQIFLNVRYQGKRYRLFTGKKIPLSKWDSDKGRANARVYKNNPIGFNDFLKGLESAIEKLLNDNKPHSAADLKALISKANGKTTIDTFFGFCQDYLKQQIEKGAMKPISAKSYQLTLTHLEKVNKNLTFESVDLNFYDKFVTQLRNKGLSTNSIGSHIKHLKWFMSAALDRDLHSNVSFRKKAFKVPNEETDQIYLTLKEVNKLAKKSMTPKLKRVADAFVLNCYLGMRFSDLEQIQKQNFKKEGSIYYLHMVQGKTNEKVTIPVPNEAVNLLRKYNFTCPVLSKKGKLISVQKFNDYLKQAAEKAELNELADIRENGEVKKLPKHELIKSHTARRTFATNLYLEGVAVQNIMAVTGHKKEQTFLLYVRADQLTKAQGLAKHYQKGKAVMKVTKGGKAA